MRGLNGTNLRASWDKCRRFLQSAPVLGTPGSAGASPVALGAPAKGIVERTNARWHPGRRRRGRRRPRARARALPGIRIRRRSACSWLQYPSKAFLKLAPFGSLLNGAKLRRLSVGTGDTMKLRSVGCKFRGARPSRVLVEASRLDELLAWMRLQPSESEDRKAIRWTEVRAGGTPAPARETRALPGAALYFLPTQRLPNSERLQIGIFAGFSPHPIEVDTKSNPEASFAATRCNARSGQKPPVLCSPGFNRRYDLPKRIAKENEVSMQQISPLEDLNHGANPLYSVATACKRC